MYGEIAVLLVREWQTCQQGDAARPGKLGLLKNTSSETIKFSRTPCSSQGFSPLPHIQRQSRAGKEGQQRHRNVRNVAKSFNSRAQAMPPSQGLVQVTLHQGRQKGDSGSSWCILAPISLQTETLCCPPHFWLYLEGLAFPSCGQMETTAMAENLCREAEGKDINAQRNACMKGHTLFHTPADRKLLTKNKAEKDFSCLPKDRPGAKAKMTVTPEFCHYPQQISS